MSEAVLTCTRHSRRVMDGIPRVCPIFAPQDATTVVSQAVFAHKFRTKPLKCQGFYDFIDITMLGSYGRPDLLCHR